MTDDAELLWRPSEERIESAAITKYLRWLRDERGLGFAGYEDLWRWSVTELEAFWASIWDFSGIIAHRGYQRVLDRRVMPGARWFDGALVNYAEQSLWRAREPEWADRPAVVCESESRPRMELSWQQLGEQVAAFAATLRGLGVRQGDRVVAYLPNVPESIVAMLAATSLGAVWSSAAPDMGAAGVLDRFQQIEPKVLVAVDGYRYGGKAFDRREVLRDIAAGLPSLETVILVPHLNPAPDLAAPGAVRTLTFGDAVAAPAPLEFTPVPFAHPLWVVYSSGTSGKPKPIVHGHGGFLLENLKSAALHLDIGDGDRFLWFTSTGWIMWNLSVVTLVAGCTVLQLDANPAHPNAGALFDFAARERATFLGTSPAYLSACIKAGVVPGDDYDLSAVRTLGSTGSPLTPEAYRWVYRHVNADLLLAGISGGTDPGAAFLTSCPILPVYAGEMQCRGLGVAAHALDDAGRELMDEVGELVVTEPMPSMPLYFWGDDGTRYRESYFETYPGLWRHGDWVRLIPRPESVTGVIYGRSDSTINRQGIRMGTSEIYRVVEEYPEIVDSLAIDLEYLGRPSYLALFVVLRDEDAKSVPPDLRARLFAAIRAGVSPRHVPDEVFVTPEVPRTLSGKKMEVPVRKILLGRPPEQVANRDATANPAALDWFADFAPVLDARLR